MAGDWFPVRVWLTKTHEIAVIAEQCQMSCEEVAGHLLNFWSFATENTANGVLAKVTISSLVRAIGARNDFWEALKLAGWLSCCEDGIVIPNWDNWMSESGKKRLKDTRRKRLRRQQTVRKKSAKRPKNVRAEQDKSGTTGQDSNSNELLRSSSLFSNEEKSKELLRSSPRTDAKPHPSGDHIWGKPPIQFDSQKAAWLGITDEQLAIWKRAYPAVDLEVALSRAAAWQMANPTNRKSDYRKFLNKWLSNDQDRAGRSPASSAHSTQTSKTTAERIAELAKKQQT